MQFVLILLLVLSTAFSQETLKENPQRSAEKTIESLQRSIESLEKLYGLDERTRKELCRKIRKTLYKAASPEFIKGKEIVFSEGNREVRFYVDSDCRVIKKEITYSPIVPDTEVLEGLKSQVEIPSVEVEERSELGFLKLLITIVYSVGLIISIVNSAVALSQGRKLTFAISVFVVILLLFLGKFVFI